ncbi:DUF945 family protein [Halomonas sp. C05BenzN]|uniref:DUF945 family protein n=1 Tax=Halomonas sp. C05BenzN TaxID=3411041 RepID=UPI003B9441BD
MRKERLIVPVVVGVAVIWAVAQFVAGVLFERELARALDDLEARGELVVERTDVEQGWLTSSGTIQLAPLLGDAWQLELGYQARHGLLSTRVEGKAVPYLGPYRERLFGDALPSTPPRWHASYHTLGGTMDGSIQLAPFLARQGERELDFAGGRIAFDGQYGDWRLQARLEGLELGDGHATLEAGPVMLESRYAYTAGAHHFTQHDLLRIERLDWRQPSLELEAHGLVYQSLMQLDDRELRIDGELTVTEVLTADQRLLTGQVKMELSRINADALRDVLAELRAEAARGDAAREGRELLARLEPRLIAMLQDSPRLDVTTVDLDSPMLRLAARGDGALFFDARRLDELSLLALEDEEQRGRWLARLDGDFTWYEVPTVVALWLGLPLDTRNLEIDVVRGEVRVNGRPMPPLWR